MTPHPKDYRPDIDGLRCLAVLPVVFSHAGLPGFGGGFVGVDIFFVISGFLITGILMREIEQGGLSILGFYDRRARRILPALFTVLAACFVAGWVLFPPQQYEALAKSAAATVLFVSNVWFWRSTGDYFSLGAELEPLLHTWSLGVEEQFYIVFPLLLWLVARRGRAWLVPVILTLTVLSFALSVWATNAAPHANFFLTPTRVWELGLGVLLALVPRLPRAPHRAVIEAIAATGLGLIVASIVLLSDQTPFPGLAALPACLGATAILWAGEQRPNAVCQMLSAPVPVFFGLISYSLYLWHWPILVLARLHSSSLNIDLTLAIPAILLSFILACLSWRFIERPFRVPPGAGGFTARSILMSSGAGGFVLIAVSGLVVLDNGAVRRLPPEVLATYRTALEVLPFQYECLAGDPTSQLCLIGKLSDENASPDALIWGDSHATAILPGFDIWLAQQGVVGVATVKTACPPLLGIVRRDRPSHHRCDAFNNDVIGYLERHPSIHTVFLIARWAMMAEGRRANGEGGRQSVLGLSDTTRADITNAGTQAIFEFGLSRTLKRLNDLGRNVVLIEGVPEMGYSIPLGLVNSAFGVKADTAFGVKTKPWLTRRDYDLRNATAQSVFVKLGKSHSFDRISIADILCDPNCIYETEGGYIYRDGHHLNAFGAKTFVPLALDQWATRSGQANPLSN